MFSLFQVLPPAVSFRSPQTRCAVWFWHVGHSERPLFDAIFPMRFFLEAKGHFTNAFFFEANGDVVLDQNCSKMTPNGVPNRPENDIGNIPKIHFEKKKI